VSLALFNPRAVNHTLGLAQMMSATGNPFTSPGALHVAEAMGAETDNAVLIAGDKEPTLWTELFLCQKCVLFGHAVGSHRHTLAELIEGRNEAQKTAQQPEPAA